MHSRSNYSQSKYSSVSQNRTIDFIISHLLIVQSQSNQIKKSFIDKLSKIHEYLASKSHSILKNFNSFTIEIDSLITSIRKGSFDVSEGSLAHCMSLPLDQASIQVQKWNLIVEEMNIEGIMAEIMKLQGFTNNLMKLYQDDEPEINFEQIRNEVRERNVVNDLQKYPMIKESIYGIQNDLDKNPQIIKSNYEKQNDISKNSQVIKSNYGIQNETNKKYETIKSNFESQNDLSKDSQMIKHNYQTHNVISKNSQLIKSNGKIYCNKNHPLKFDNLAHFQYWNTKKNFIITCGTCKEKVSEGTWNCSDCSFDVCKNCAIRANIQTPTLECSLNHNLEWKCDYSGLFIKNFTCNDCKQVISNIPRWNCMTCNFNICMLCGFKKEFNPPVSGPKCTKAHDLVSKYIGYDENDIKMCSNCNSLAIEEIYYCILCDIILCIECSNGARYPLAAHPIAACNNGHITIWNTSRYKCSYCNLISDEGFFCFLCKYKICLECCNFLTHEALNLVLEKYLDAQLYWNPRCNNLKFKKKCGNCKDELKDNGFFSTINENSQICLTCFKNPGKSSQQPKKKSAFHKLGLLLLKSLNEKNEKN